VNILCGFGITRSTSGALAKKARRRREKGEGRMEGGESGEE
jgi:hypothetical protein